MNTSFDDGVFKEGTVFQGYINSQEHCETHTERLFSTVLCPHLLPQWVDGYEVNSAHAWMDSCMSLHVNQPTRLLACTQDRLPWKTLKNNTK